MTYICQTWKNWLKEKEEEEEEEEEEKKKKEEEEKKIISQLQLPAAAASFFAACLWGIWFLVGNDTYSWYWYHVEMIFLINSCTDWNLIVSRSFILLLPRSLPWFFK